jgi:hypothetical protein
MKEDKDDSNQQELKELDEIITKLNDQIGLMGNNLIEKQIELDYLKEENNKLIHLLNSINSKNSYKNQNRNFKTMKF